MFLVGGAIGLTAFILYNTYERATSVAVALPQALVVSVENKQNEKVVMAGGCFWCTESEYNHVEGVISAVSGYTDVMGNYKEGSGPSYADVSSEAVKARESVLVVFDPKKITFDKILELYFRHIDPTDAGGQFSDRGYQYTPAIYYTSELQKNDIDLLINKITETKKFSKPVVVAVLPYKNFYPAEEYHQDYKDKNPVRYNLYREGSGRNTFIKNNWSDTSSYMKELFGGTSATILKKPMNTNTNISIGSAWNNFTQEQKAAKLKTLTPLQFNVTQKAGTEQPFQNEYQANHDKGIYVDIVSGEPLFLSSDKYDSGTGWPSFVKPINNAFITLHVDNGIFSTRTEVRSKIADSHLGHVFDDGPSDQGGKRYCLNSAALRFVPIADMEKEGYGEFIQLIK